MRILLNRLYEYIYIYISVYMNAQIKLPAYEVWHPVFMLENCEVDDECFVRPYRNLTRVIFTPHGLGNYWITKMLYVDCDMDLYKCALNLILEHTSTLVQYSEYTEYKRIQQFKISVCCTNLRIQLYAHSTLLYLHEAMN